MIFIYIYLFITVCSAREAFHDLVIESFARKCIHFTKTYSDTEFCPKTPIFMEVQNILDE